MKIIKLAAVVAALFFGYQYVYGNPLVGQWKSNKELTLNEWEKSNVSKLRVRKLKNILGKMTFTITKDKWDYDFDGNVGSQSYEILASNGDCHTVQTSEKGKTETQEICVVDNNLYMPQALLNSREVFSKI